VNAAVKAVAPDICFHLAAVSAIAQASEDPRLAWAVNLHGTLHLAGAIRAHAPDCVLLHVSSADAYGASFQSGVALDEFALLAPINTYGVTKAAADLAIGAFASEGMRAIRLRPFNHTGPGQSDAFVISAFARQIAAISLGQQAPIIEVGSLDSERDFLDVNDVCEAYALCAAAVADLPSGTIFNIASGRPRRIGDILARLLELADVSAEVRPNPKRMRSSDLPTATGDAGCVRRALGWTPVVKWDDTLHSVIRYWRDLLTR
jgi:GDP-4-dehydro-6-deoxy-D-mannose reductase